jgi:hypothetical protein
MASLDMNAVREVMAARNYLFTEHGSDRAVERDITCREVEETVASGEIIEDYPDDKYGPSCLIMGVTSSGRVLHVHISYPPTVKIITVYEPSSDEWEDGFRKRKAR